MSANADVLQPSDLIGSRTQTTALPQVRTSRDSNDWNPHNFAREQIRGLVQRVFFAGEAPAVRQVVFSAVEPNTDVAELCRQVGHALALEARGDVAIVNGESRGDEPEQAHDRVAGSMGIKAWSTQLSTNLWHVTRFGLRKRGEGPGTGAYWTSCLTTLRSEFDYAVIHALAAGVSSEAARLGQLADGIILVLGAHSTRKATARKIKETLEGTQSRILGTVLSERRFPVPARLYRRL
jgi:hypothetical protein